MRRSCFTCIFSLTAFIFQTLCPHLSTAYGQGNLTPPGAPAPTMKTLSQVEPRTPISSAPFTIASAGSYYLTGNLSVTNGNAITIGTNEVTLDLNGFTISSTAATATGRGIFLVSDLRNITILNGFIRGVTNNNGSYSGSGFSDGISYPYPTPDPGSENGTPPINCRVVGVSVIGCLNHGIYLGHENNVVVESCLVRNVGGEGITADIVKNCSATLCGEEGISGRFVSDSRGETTGPAAGIQAITAQNCFGNSTGGGIGIFATTALNCSGNNSGSGRGVSATTAQNCSGSSAAGTGVYAKTAMNCSGSQNGIGAGIGLLAEGTAMSCYGFSTEGTGLVASNACFCTGSRLGGGRAIEAIVGTGCIAIEGTNKITFKYNMP